MTPIAIAWTIAAALWAGVLALAGIWLLNRWLRRPAAREPEEAPHETAAAARPWRLLLLLVPRTLRDRTPQHEGATLDWSPAGDLAHVGQSPELAPVLTEVEIRYEVHDQLDVMMAAFRHDLDHILDGVCRRLDPLWAPVAVAELAAVTG